jgi:hypothetical protein
VVEVHVRDQNYPTCEHTVRELLETMNDVKLTLEQLLVLSLRMQNVGV